MHYKTVLLVEADRYGGTYAHSYCSGERGSNENNNKFIRRFKGKDEDFSNYSYDEIWEIEGYINNYPRALFKGKSSNCVYNELRA